MDRQCGRGSATAGARRATTPGGDRAPISRAQNGHGGPRAEFAEFADEVDEMCRAVDQAGAVARALAAAVRDSGGTGASIGCSGPLGEGLERLRERAAISLGCAPFPLLSAAWRRYAKVPRFDAD